MARDAVNIAGHINTVSNARGILPLVRYKEKFHSAIEKSNWSAVLILEKHQKR
ncbi:hypothetical protein FACS1894200_01710 [Spirochaetia bacterium]|nr:hypothetical protein FACS1894200_01710 [Spirochaetia bacterium]